MAARPLGKDFKDEKRPVIDRQSDMTLEIALLGRTERLVKQDFNGAMGLGKQPDFFGLATADKQGRVGGFALAGQTGYRMQTGGFGEQPKFMQPVIEMRQPKINADQQSGRDRV